MGMAASQARYLELEARQTNVEYQGQQINQQRTELSEVSNGLFTQLMGLQVPIAPSSTNYTTTNYTFNNGANDCTIAEGGIQALAGDPNYNSTVTYTYNTSPYTGIGQTRTDLGVNDLGAPGLPAYWLTDGAAPPTNKAKLTQCSTADSNYSTDVTALTQIVTDNTGTVIASKVNGFDPTSDATKAATIGNIWKYTTSGTTYYYTGNQLATAAGLHGAATTTNGYYAANINKTNTVTEKAYVTQASSGRYSSIQLQSTGNTNFNLTTTTSTNAAAYNDAMNEYTYQQAAYEQQITNINAKTSIIQNEDKTLELQLAQLDTEQKALSTELDSVKKIIDKNIETTYKTFS